jgi:adenosylhomocysteine nucleosidase
MTLLCAATKWEAQPLAKALRLTEGAPGVFERSDRRVTLLKTGIGPENTTLALRRWRGAGPPAVAAGISVGFAGALQPGMRTGDIVCDLRGCDLDVVRKARETAELLGLRIHFGKMLHSDKVLSSPQEKTALGRKERGSAVDMETSAVRDFARSAGISFLCIRVVLDPVHQALPSCLPAGEDFISLARYAVSNARELPLLAALGLKQRAAAAALSLFLRAYLEAA